MALRSICSISVYRIYKFNAIIIEEATSCQYALQCFAPSAWSIGQMAFVALKFEVALTLNIQAPAAYAGRAIWSLKLESVKPHYLELCVELLCCVCCHCLVCNVGWPLHQPLWFYFRLLFSIIVRSTTCTVLHKSSWSSQKYSFAGSAMRRMRSPLPF